MSEAPPRPHNASAVNAPWTLSAQEVQDALGTSLESGLAPGEAASRLKQYGPNRLAKKKTTPAWKIFVEQFRNLIVLLLAIAMGLSAVFGQWLEAASVAVAIGFNIIIGFFTELEAVRSMESLEKLGQAKTRTIRGGSAKEIPAAKLVPGDIVVLEAGDVIPADLRVIEEAQMQADEALLTGESMSVAKNLDPAPEDAPLAERSCMLYKGATLAAGSGHGVVTATGMHTELGRIAQLTEDAEQKDTPLEKRLDRLGRRLLFVTVAITVVVALVGVLTGMELFLVIETAIALAVAAIPEGLPVVATIALARGMWRLAKRNALLQRLSAVETLGAVSAICTDKTGTLTENRMHLSQLAHAGDCGEKSCYTSFDKQTGAFTYNGETLHPAQDSPRQEVWEAIRVGVLCNNAQLGRDRGGSGEKSLGDPLEIALLEAGAAAGYDRADLLQQFAELREVAFSQENMMMATYHRLANNEDGSVLVAVKGAPEAVLQHCDSVLEDDALTPLDDQGRERWEETNRAMASRGLRMLALARKLTNDENTPPYEGLTLLGLVGLQDPARDGVADAIAECHDAGIRVIMVTGDQAHTAAAIASELGLAPQGAEPIHGSEIGTDDGWGAQAPPETIERLTSATVFSRVSPEQKLRLVELLQNQGDVVGMTGDGVNDAPALKKADIGIAMGKRGTQAASEAAAMVLKDDAFSTIVMAIKQGRGIFNNIRRFIIFLLSGNMAEIAIVAVAMLLGMPLPLLPLQILYLNMLGDVFPALALGMGHADDAAMRRPPRDSGESIITGAHWWGMSGYAAVITAAVLVSFALALYHFEMPQKQAVGISFLTLAFARLWHVFNMRGIGTNPINNVVTRNPFVWGALGICIGLLLLAVWLPVLSEVLALGNPGLVGWQLIIGCSLAPTAFIQIVLLVLDAREKKK